MKTKLFILLFLVFSITPGLLFAQFTQQGPKLVGAGSLGMPGQGRSVAISADGNTAIIGGADDTNSIHGAVWIFVRSGGVWTQQGPKLVGSGAVGSTGMGWSVAISADGNTVAAGGWGDNILGAVWVFTRTGNVWTQQGTKLVGTGAVGYSWQGYSVTLTSDGNTLVEGGYADNNDTGAVWVFTRSGGVWSQHGQKLVGAGRIGHSNQGSSVAVSSDGSTIIVGGCNDNGLNGAIWVFFRSGNAWTQQGPKLVGTGAIGNGSQGRSVTISMDGNTAIEGGYTDNNSAGAVWVFTRTEDTWTQQGPKLIGSGATSGIVGSNQGFSVAISPDGNNIVEGGWNDGNGIGAVWVFNRSGEVWSQLGSKLIGSGAAGFSGQGRCVAISSEGTVIEGGPGDNNQIGAVWVFRDPTIGIQPITHEIPKLFSLLQNYPNPFNPTTKIKFDIPKASLVQIKVYDILGRAVATFVNESLNPGEYETEWNASDFASGVYYYQLTISDEQQTIFSETKKLILIK